MYARPKLTWQNEQTPHKIWEKHSHRAMNNHGSYQNQNAQSQTKLYKRTRTWEIETKFGAMALLHVSTMCSMV